MDAHRRTVATPEEILPGGRPARPWHALWALVLGFFLILLDSSIISVANPAITTSLDQGVSGQDQIGWVTSAYLLAYAVPLLISGRLGDRFGPKRIYLIGLAAFTFASLWCGLSPSWESLIAARAVQGLGAAAMAPQIMAVITRIFPAARRGTAMGLWGATAGVATLAGPLLGGVLVEEWGWQWIFFVNVPVGIVAFVLAFLLVPRLKRRAHRFDPLAVVLSAAGLFLVVYGVQQGNAHGWGVIDGPITVWGTIGAGLVLLVIFGLQQWRTSAERLVPVGIFRDRNFATASVAIAAVGFAVTSMSMPLMLFLQIGRGLEPTQAAYLLIPMAVLSAVLSPVAGRLLDRHDPRMVVIPGILSVAAGLVWYSALMTVDTPLWAFLLPSVLMGIGNAGLWGPLATSATRRLPLAQAGAAAGIYNTARILGSTIGTAAIAALMQARFDSTLQELDREDLPLPDAVADAFAAETSWSILLPAVVILVALAAALFLRGARTPDTTPGR